MNKNANKSCDPATLINQLNAWCIYNTMLHVLCIYYSIMHVISKTPSIFYVACKIWWRKQLFKMHAGFYSILYANSIMHAWYSMLHIILNDAYDIPWFLWHTMMLIIFHNRSDIPCYMVNAIFHISCDTVFHDTCDIQWRMSYFCCCCSSNM